MGVVETLEKESVYIEKIIDAIEEVQEFEKTILDASNKHILKITSGKRYSIKDVQRELGFKTYKSAFDRVKHLERTGIVRLITDTHTRGSKKIIIPCGKKIITMYRHHMEKFNSELLKS